MSITKLTRLFSDLIGQRVYAIQFPDFMKGQAIKLEITTGISDKGGIKDFNVQLMIKADHPATAEDIALQVIQSLDMRTDIEFDDNRLQLVLCKATAPQPYYVGELVSGEYIYSIDFRLLVAEI